MRNEDLGCGEGMVQARIRIYGRPPYRSGTQPSWVRFAQEPQSKGSLHQMGPTEEQPATPGPHRSAGSPYKACRKRDTVMLLLRHYEVTCSGCMQ